MRLVLDTNAVIAAAIGSSASARPIELASDGEIDLYSSVELISELAEVLAREHIAVCLARKKRTAAEVLLLYQTLVESVLPAVITTTAPDPDDDAVLACALAAHADLIVTGDKPLRNLKYFHTIPILDPGSAVLQIEKYLAS